MEKRPEIRLYGTSRQTQNSDSKFVILRIEDKSSKYSVTIRRKVIGKRIELVPSISKIDKRLKLRFDFSKPELEEDEVCSSCIHSLIRLFTKEAEKGRLLLDPNQIWKHGHLVLKDDKDYGDFDSIFTDNGIIWKSTTKPDKKSDDITELTGHEVASIHSLSTPSDWARLVYLLTEFENFGRCFDKDFFGCDHRREHNQSSSSDDSWSCFPADSTAL